VRKSSKDKKKENHKDIEKYAKKRGENIKFDDNSTTFSTE